MILFRRGGGDGLMKELEFLEAATVTILIQPRNQGSRGFSGGGDVSS